MKLTDACIERPVFAWMIMAAVVTLGGIAAFRIGVSQYPDVDFPTITIAVNWEGAAPEAVEHDVVEIVEEAVTQVEGVRSIRSTSRQGSANITVELDLSRDVDAALQDVQTRVAQAQQRLPRDLDPPVISKNNPEDQPIMWIGLSGPFPRQFLSDFARYRLKPKLQGIRDVGEVFMGGYLERNVRIWIDADRLDETGLTVGDVLGALAREHVELPAGRLETGGREIAVRVLGEAIDLAELRRIVVRPGAAPIYLEQVALVEDGFEDERRLSRVNGLPAQGLGVKKQRGANAVAVARDVRALIEELRPTLPPGLELGINFDSTTYIEQSIEEVELELVMAVILTGLVCWMFLGSLSSTLNVILAIPMSLLGTTAVIYFLGFTFNTFTLLGMALAVGIVVDDAIMVLENIVRHAEGGVDRVRAAREGTAQIAFAALAATLAVVAIFTPVLFMKGVIGKYFLQFGVTLSCAVLLSYLEAITLAPARCAQLLEVGRHRRRALGRLVDRAFSGLERRYARALKVALRFPAVALVAAVAVFAGSYEACRRMPQELVPSQDQSRLMVRVQTAVGATLAETDRVFRAAEAFVNTRPEVERAFAVIGGFGGSGVNSGILFVTLVPPDRRRITQAELAALLRRELNSIPGARAVVQDLSQMGFTAQRGFPLEFSVQGPDFDQLVASTDQLMEDLRATKTVVDLDSDYERGMPELEVVPDRARAADLDVPIETVATTINALVGGVRAGKYSSGGRRVDVRVRLLANQRTRPEDLTRLQVRSRGGALVPLSALVTYSEHPALQAVMRVGRERAITVFGNIAPGHSQADALAEVERLSRALPTGYHATFGGQSAVFRDSFDGILFALVLGVLIAYMVLASQFNSFLHPVTVLTILPLSAAGAIFALYVAGRSLNMFSMIGLVLLMGIAKKNSIILVDYAVRLREQGLDARAAALQAGPTRLRPILMTSITTFLAALPSALGLGSGAEVRAPMAIGVMGGLALSTALSLFVVPCFYVGADRLVGGLSRRRAHAPAVPPSGA